MNYTPLFDKLLVKRDEVAEKTETGIYLPDEAREAQRPHTGLVLAIGEQVKAVKKGDRVFYSKYSGLETELNGEALLILKEEDLLLKEIC